MTEAAEAIYPCLSNILSLAPIGCPILNLGPPTLLLPHVDLIKDRRQRVLIFEYDTHNCFLSDYRGSEKYFKNKVRSELGDVLTSIYTNDSGDFTYSLHVMGLLFQSPPREVVEKYGVIVIADTCDITSLGEIRSSYMTRFYDFLGYSYRPYANKHSAVILNTNERRVPGTSEKYSKAYFNDPHLLYSAEYGGRGLIKQFRRVFTAWGTQDTVYERFQAQKREGTEALVLGTRQTEVENLDGTAVSGS